MPLLFVSFVTFVLLAMLIIAWFSPRSMGFRRITGTAYLAVTLVFVAFPFFYTIYRLVSDDGLRGAAPSEFAFSLHGSLSDRLPAYIDERIESNVASTLSVHQITATEWPVYVAFFYLQATERLQKQWEADRSLASEAPAVSGSEAIEASVRIMLDHGHSHWVRTYWGDDYLEDENGFYRMLLIGCLTSHHNLTGSEEHFELLRKVTNDLAGDLDVSRHGLIDDYPGQCFPCDVASAIAMVERAAAVLGDDRSEWASVAFQRMMKNFPSGLPPYMANPVDGSATALSRGCTNGFFFTYSMQLSPDDSPGWYQNYVSEFWQQKAFAGGWREFSNTDDGSEFYFDPDSGPVLFGFGTGATGLGLGCARVHGDDHRAGILGAELIAASLPMPNGTLLIPRLVSDREHAPYFAEIAILHQLSMVPPSLMNHEAQRVPIPWLVWIILMVQGLLMLGLVWLSVRLMVPKHRRSAES